MELCQETIRVNGVALNVASAGAGPAVLLLHGFPDTHLVWRKQVPALLEAGYRVIAPDLRGYGGSDAPAATRSYSLEVLRADMVGLLDAMEVAQAYVVGHDWGAVIGWHLCMHAPERVERFAALSVGHPRAYTHAGLGQLLRAWYAGVFQLPWVAEKLVMAGNLRALAPHATDDAQLANWRANFAREGRVTAALNYYRANRSVPGSENSRPLPGPILGVWSEGDPALTEAQMRDSAKYVSGTFQYERIDGAVGHWPQLKVPERVNALLIAFRKS